MRQYLVSLYFALIAISAKAQNDTTWFDTDWVKISAKDTAAFYRPAPVKQANGLYLVRDYYKSGALQWEGYSSDIKEYKYEGIGKRYYENGDIESEEYFVNGKEQGTSKGYYKNGKKEFEIQCVNGKRHGLALFYREDNGATYRSIQFKRDIYHGDIIEYHYNGKIKRMEKWNNSHFKSGKCYDSNGKVIPFYQAECCPIHPGGLPAYYKYIKDSMRYPRVCKEEGVRGVVVMLATIDTVGKVRKVSITQSLHPDCDAEAKRLILNMPTQIPSVDYMGNKMERTIDFEIYFGKIPAGAIIIDPISSIIRNSFN